MKCDYFEPTENSSKLSSGKDFGQLRRRFLGHQRDAPGEPVVNRRALGHEQATDPENRISYLRIAPEMTDLDLRTTAVSAQVARHSANSEGRI